jgi:hypothetical protein
MILCRAVEGDQSPTSSATRKIRNQCADFLTRFKVATNLGHFSALKRSEFIQNLFDLSLCPNDALKIIEELTVDDYCAGPEPDHYDQSIEVWTFGYRLKKNTEVYIKLRMRLIARGKIEQAELWSFHRSKHSMTYPLRGAR